MNAKPWDESEYPYAARNGSAQSPFAAEATFQLERARFVWRWLARVGIFAVAIIFIVTAIVGFITFRTVRRAWLANELAELGCRVVHAHQLSTASDPVPGFIREQLGESFWTEIVELHVQGPYSYWGQGPAVDTIAICQTCKSLPALHTFTASEGTFAFAQLADWRSLHRLENVELNCETLTQADVAVLRQMTALKKLRLGSTKLTADGIAALSQLPALESLTLDSVQPSDPKPIASAASGFVALTSLTVYQSPTFDDEVLLAFGPLPQLKDANFIHTPIGDRGFEHLLKSGKVNNLNVNHGVLTDASLAILAKHPAPGHVELWQMPLTDAGLKALAGKAFPVLIFDRTALTDEAFETLASIRGIEHVSLIDTQVTGTGVSHLNRQLPLGYLDLTGTPLSPEGILVLSAANISRLNLSRTSLTDTDLMLFANNDDRAELTVTQSKVTPEGLTAFYRARQRRLSAAGRTEHLMVNSDYEEITESFLNGSLPLPAELQPQP